jgi:hypothetical protein
MRDLENTEVCTAVDRFIAKRLGAYLRASFRNTMSAAHFGNLSHGQCGKIHMIIKRRRDVNGIYTQCLDIVHRVYTPSVLLSRLVPVYPLNPLKGMTAPCTRFNQISSPAFHTTSIAYSPLTDHPDQVSPFRSAGTGQYTRH